jgi:hypothetical protein
MTAPITGECLTTYQGGLVMSNGACTTTLFLSSTDLINVGCYLTGSTLSPNAISRFDMTLLSRTS